MFHHHLCSWFFFYCYGDHRDLHVLPHSFPTHALPISGSRVSAGAPLFTIVDASVVWLTVHVPAEQASRIARGSQASFQVEGSSTIGRTSRTVSVGTVVVAVSRSVPVIYGVANTDGAFRVGAAARVAVATGAQLEGNIVPRSEEHTYELQSLMRN